jgi:hypothetical protein
MEYAFLWQRLLLKNYPPFKTAKLRDRKMSNPSVKLDLTFSYGMVEFSGFIVSSVGHTSASLKRA